MAPSSSVHTPTGPSMGHGFSLGKKKHSLMRMMTPPTPKPSKMKVRFLIASFKKKQDESVHNILRNCIFFLLPLSLSLFYSSLLSDSSHLYIVGSFTSKVPLMNHSRSLPIIIHKLESKMESDSRQGKGLEGQRTREEKEMRLR